MRALCGAIIAAGALLGLGLAAIGVGTRYAWYQSIKGPEDAAWIRFWQMDTGLIVIIVLCICSLIVGLAIALLGLAYHHHRRYHEHLRAMGGYPASETRSSIG